MKLRKLIILTIFVIIITSALIIFSVKLYKKSKIIKTQEFDIFIQISNSSGWNLETENINFGKLMVGDSSARFINLNNDLDQDIIIKIKAEGEIKDWLSYPEEIILSEKSSKEIEISATAPNMPKGNYTGKVIIIYYKK